MARKSIGSEVTEMRVKLLATNLKEGEFEQVVRVPYARAEALILAKQARRAEIGDFALPAR